MHDKHIPLYHKIHMGPLDKYVTYGKFPYKLLVHACLLLTLTVEIFIITKTSETNNRM